MLRGISYHLERKHYNRIRFPETLFPLMIKAVIVFLCVYIAARCINLISGNTAETAVKNAVSNTSNVIAKENGELSEEAKKKLLTEVVADYIKHSEYTYDTEDPGYEQVINLVYENVTEATEQTTAAVEKETTKKQEKEKTVKASAKVLVPLPKVSGKLYTIKNIGSFRDVIDRFYTITSATNINSSDMPIRQALNEKFQIKGNNKKPQILIYHTHSQEEFSNSTGDAGTTIIGVGDRLEKVLREQFGYNVIHDTTHYDMVNGKLDRNEAYDQAREGVSKILKKYPSISLVLDIHRDGVNSNTRLVTEVLNIFIIHIFLKIWHFPCR